MIFHYEGDDPAKNRIVSWFQAQMQAIGTCFNAALPEATLTIIYSGIDTLGLLDAPAGVEDANRTTYKDWCEKYVLPRLQSVDGTAITSVDLYAARCGVLHTSTPRSSLERAGNARQIWYQFLDKTGVDMLLSTQHMPLQIDLEKLAMAFKEGGIAFIEDLNSDPVRFQLADSRSQHFLRWAKRVS